MRTNPVSVRKLVEIITPLHKGSSRDYVGRMVNDKAACMRVGRRFEKDFWAKDFDLYQMVMRNNIS